MTQIMPKLLITSQTAKDMQLKGAAIKVSRRLAEKQELLALRHRFLNPPPPPKELAKDARVRALDGLIQKTIERFKESTEPRDMQALAMALDRLLGSWSLLTGHPRPGTARPSKRGSAPSSFQALEPEITPEIEPNHNM